MSLRELDLFGVIGLLGVVSVLRAFVSRHPRLPRERRKKERKKEREKEREKERKKERDTHPYISFTYPHILTTSIFSPFFFGGFSSQQKTHIDRVYHRHACLDELLRCGAVQAHWGKCRRRWTTLRGGVSSSKASRRCRDNKRDSMHARQEAAREKRRVRV